VSDERKDSNMSENQPEQAPDELQAPEDVAAKDSTGVGVFTNKSDADAYVKDQDQAHEYVTRKV
jgi:hypothetical protein